MNFNSLLLMLSLLSVLKKVNL